MVEEKIAETYPGKVDVGDMPKKYDCFGVRHLQMACMCFTMISLFIARGSMGVAVLAMSDENRKNDTTVTIYDWDKKTQSVILSSFFWGYVAMQIPAGILAKKFGGKPILLFALLVNGCLSSLLPTLAALGGWMCVCFARVMMGLSQACLYPASHTLLGQWFPPKERTGISGLIYGGMQVGIIIAMPLSGLLAETAIGWKLNFYVMSGLLFLNAAVWYWFAASSPAEHRMISKEERQYIETSLHSGGSQKSMSTPWRRILTSVPLYAIMATHVACTCSFVLFFVDMPTYLEKGLQISLKNSAVLSALPYVGMWIGNVGSSLVAEKLLNRKLLSVTACRKLFNSLAMFGIAGGLVALSFLGPENKSLAILAIVITNTMCGFTVSGFMVNGLDLSPNFAGVLLSLTNFAANICSILMPIITSVILRNNPTDVSRWRLVFLMTAVITAGGNIIYLCFASSERQEWNDPDYCDKKSGDPAAFGQRHVQVVLIFFGLVLAYAMRVNMSLAIVAMTDPHAGGNSCSAEYCKAYVNQTFNWSVGTRSVILSSFFWGYVVLQVPGGELANRVGGKLLLASSIAINSILLMAIPTCAYYGGWQLVVVCRVLQGLFQGVTFPSVHNLLGKWVPVEEKSRLGQFVYAGSQLGTALQLITAGYIADQWGWPMIFYSVGILGAIWTLFYLKLGAASPQSSNTISPDERGYIESSLGTVQVHKKLQTPWKAIMTSKQFLALVLVHCGQNWGFWTLLTEIPSYMELVLKVNIKSNGVLSALPYLMMFILSFVFSIILDNCHNKQLFSLSTSRKISNSIGFYGAAAALIGIVYAPSHSLTASVALLAIAVGVNAGHITGLVLVHIDMAPNFAGSLMGVTNGLANIVSIVAPLVAAIILKDESDPKFWKVVFFLAAAVYVVTNTIFIIFGTSERQPWNDPSDEYKPLL